MTDHESLVGARCRVGKSLRVHIIRGSTIHTRRNYGTTFCGYYGNPWHGWMKLTEDAPTCKSCLKAAGTA